MVYIDRFTVLDLVRSLRLERTDSCLLTFSISVAEFNRVAMHKTDENFPQEII